MAVAKLPEVPALFSEAYRMFDGRVIVVRFWGGDVEEGISGSTD